MKFSSAIKGRDRISIIAEIKRRSPGFGEFPKHDLQTLVRAYEEAGAAAISVVTETPRFGGTIELLREVRQLTKKPILRKDFILSVEQIMESRHAGADAVLLIASDLSAEKLGLLIRLANEAGIECLCEVHDEADLTKVLALGHLLIGINNRNLQTHKTDVRHALSLLPLIPTRVVIVAESGFDSPRDLAPYRGRVDAALIGTSLLAAVSPFEKLGDFVTERSK